MSTTKSTQVNKHSDKVGELIKWSQNMDKLDNKQLLKHAKFIFNILTVTQVKSVLFSGLLKCRENIEYDQIYSMQNNLESYDISKDKKQENKRNDNKYLDVHLNEINEEKEMDLQNKISWLDMIPTDIILNNVCSCLWMKDIFNFSKCGRRYAIICHSPPAMNNFQLCIRGDDICSEENYFHKHRTDHHRLRGVKNLTINAHHANECIKIPHYLTSFFIELKNVQHLTFIGTMPNINQFAKPYFQELKSISFVDCDLNNRKWLFENDQNIMWLFPNNDEKENINNNANEMQKKFFKSEYNLETINFNNCSFSNNLLPYLHDLLLSSKINKLSVLKLQPVNLWIKNNDRRPHFKQIFDDENLIRQSLCHLRAFVTSAKYMSKWDVGCILARRILSTLKFQLECIHINSSDNEINAFPFPYLMQDSKYYQNGKQKEILHLKELCISFPATTEAKDLLFKKICANLLEDVFLTHLPQKNNGGLQKLCLIFPSFSAVNEFVNNSMKIMLKKSTSLNFLHLKIDFQYIHKFFESAESFIELLCSAFSDIANESLANTSSAAFVFKLEINYLSESLCNKLIESFLLAFPNGLFQYKCGDVYYNLNEFLKDAIFYTESEIGFSVRNIHAVEKYVVYDTQWICDCKNCV